MCLPVILQAIRETYSRLLQDEPPETMQNEDENPVWRTLATYDTTVKELANRVAYRIAIRIGQGFIHSNVHAREQETNIIQQNVERVLYEVNEILSSKTGFFLAYIRTDYDCLCGNYLIHYAVHESR